MISRYQASVGIEDNGHPVLAVDLFNLSGQMVGYQVYRPWSTDKKCNDPKTGRYYTYATEGVDAVFGLETDTGTGPLFTVEGIFKAAKLHDLGYNAIAVLTSHPKRMRPWFRILRKKRRLIGIGDIDHAGKKLVNTIKEGGLSPIDLDEMSDQDVHEFVRGLINESNSTTV